MGKKRGRGRKHGRRRGTKRRRMGTGRIAQPRFSLTRSNGPMPQSFKAVCRYTASLGFEPSTGPSIYVFRANDGFDPDATGTGHQPLGTDQLFAFYQRGYVIATQIKLVINNQDGDQTAIVGVIPTRDLSTVPTTESFLEDRRARFTVCPPSSGGGSRVVSYKICPYKWLGIKNPGSEADYQFTAVGSPAIPLYLKLLVVMGDDLAITNGKVHVHVIIDYVVVFNEPIKVQAS